MLLSSRKVKQSSMKLSCLTNIKSHVTDQCYDEFHKNRRSEKVLQVIKSSLDFDSVTISKLNSKSQLFQECKLKLGDHELESVTSRYEKRELPQFSKLFSESDVHRNMSDTIIMLKRHQETADELKSIERSHPKVNQKLKYEKLKRNYMKNRCVLEATESQIIQKNCEILKLEYENKGLKNKLDNLTNSTRDVAQAKDEEPMKNRLGMNNDNKFVNGFKQSWNAIRAEKKIAKQNSFKTATLKYQLEIYKTRWQNQVNKLNECESDKYHVDSLILKNGNLRNENEKLRLIIEQMQTGFVELAHNFDNLEAQSKKSHFENESRLQKASEQLRKIFTKVSKKKKKFLFF